ncbi:MAG: hypothetical protein BMS9Abin32_271 [Gammaproteobacteria bacterium]|nr:MAG: hypothetical protein BMS9Abin32_271 [Gammaproteobacteria bacterium]
MGMQIRDVRSSDIEAVRLLNESVVPQVNSVNTERMLWFAENADYFRVAENGGGIAGMLIGFRPGEAYSSPYYRWFCERFDDFAYIDRVAIAAAARRQGLASAMYRDFESHFRQQVPRLACEVNLLPPNDTSLEFHRRMGFVRVENAVIEPGLREVTRLVKEF